MSLAIILVEPEIPENIGFVARTMNCYQQTDLRFVKKRKLLTASRAYKTGTKGRDILSKAQYFSSLKDSLFDIHLALGFTRRKRSIQDRRVTDINESLTSMQFNQNVALVFGKESEGLTQDDCRLLNKLIYIDLPDTSSCLNLSHCVTVVLHEIYYHSIKTHHPFPQQNRYQPLENLDSKMTLGEKNQTLENFLEILSKNNIFKENKKLAHLNYLQDLWTRASPNKAEMDFLIGLFKKIKTK